MRRVRLILWAIIALTLAALAFVSLRPQQKPPQPAPMALTSFGGPFTLTGSDGKPFSSSKLNGKPYALFFGFTRCPDVCPTTLARLVRLRQQLGAGDQSFPGFERCRSGRKRDRSLGKPSEPSCRR